MQVKLTTSMLPSTQTAAQTGGQAPSRPANSDGASLPPAGTPLPVPGSHTTKPSPLEPETALFGAALQQLKTAVKHSAPGLTITAGLQSGYVVAKLVDPQTKKVLLELPPRQVIKLAQQPEQLSGLLVRVKA